MFENFNWINEGEIKIEGNKVVIKAPALTDFFCGGSTTALAVNINTYPTHIAGLPVAVNICCHVNRHCVREI